MTFYRPQIKLYFSSILILLFSWEKVVSVSARDKVPIDEWLDRLPALLNSEKLDANLKYLTEHPHIAGSKRNNELADEIARRWKSYRFDKVEKVRYDILLSLPDSNHPSSSGFVNTKTGEYTKQFALHEKALIPAENQDDILPSFLGFTCNATVIGHVVYANFGRKEDFKELSDLGVSVKGHIALVKMGRVFRGDKIKYAAESGASGVLIYNDPEQFAPDGINNTYPNKWWFPGTGIQRGAAAYDVGPGDVVTPGYPSIEGIYRTPLIERKKPAIPAHDISYNDALVILKSLKGKKAPKGWQGKLPVTYRTGPGFKDDSQRVKVNVKTYLNTKPVYNVIGTIKGTEEPDRYVLMGNHRDAWVFGASDPSSGTSVLMELSRGLGELLKVGWRPRRTIMLCSWDAEEQFVTGSTEWVEDNAAVLKKRAVAYLNIDTAVGGNFSFNVDGSPLLKDVLVQTTREVLDPTAKQPGQSLYDVMLERDVTKNAQKRGECDNVAFGSDYVAFYHFLGISSCDFTYIFGGVHNIRRSYPFYHSMHDGYYWVKTFVDPFFKIHLAVSQYASRLLLKFSDAMVLPMNSTTLVEVIEKESEILANNPDIKENNIDVSVFRKTVKELRQYSDMLEQRRRELIQAEPIDERALRVINDQLSMLERAWIDDIRQYPQIVFRNILYGPEWKNIYEGKYFSRIYDAIDDAKAGGSWENVKREISVVIFALKSAGRILEPIV